MAMRQGSVFGRNVTTYFLRVKYDWACHLFTYFIYFSRINMLMGVPQ